MKQYITYGFVVEDIKNIKTDLETFANMKPKSALCGFSSRCRVWLERMV